MIEWIDALGAVVRAAGLIAALQGFNLLFPFQ